MTKNGLNSTMSKKMDTVENNLNKSKHAKLLFL